MQIILNLLNNVFDANTQAKFVFLFFFPLWFQSYTPDSIEKKLIVIFILLLQYFEIITDCFGPQYTGQVQCWLLYLLWILRQVIPLFTLCRNEGIWVIWTHSSMLKQITIGHHICLCLNH